MCGLLARLKGEDNEFPALDPGYICSWTAYQLGTLQSIVRETQINHQMMSVRNLL